MQRSMDEAKKLSVQTWRPKPTRIAIFAAIALIGVFSKPIQAQQLNPIAPLSFTMPLAGDAPLPQMIEATSSNGGFLQSYVSAATSTGGNWLKVSPGGYNNAPFALAVSVDHTAAATLPAGTYTGAVTLTPNNGSPALNVPVTLTVATADTSFLDNLPGGLSFSSAAQRQPPSQVIEVRNAGAGALNWTVAPRTSDGGNWLTVSSVSGTAPLLLTVGVAANKLPNGGALAGIYTGQLLFTCGSGSVTVPVTVSIGGNSLVQINPLSFAMPLHGSAPLTQVAEVTSSTGAFLQSYVSASTGTGGNWLKVSPGGYNNAPFALAVGVDQTVASLLPAGSYTGEVILTPNSGSAAAMTIPVTLTIAPPTLPFFDNVPGALNFSVKANASNPPDQLMEIRNAGSGILNWNLIASTSDGGNWLTVSPGTGFSPATLAVGVVAHNLPNGGLVAGIFTGNLLFELAGGTTTVTVPITVSVGGNSLVQINPLSFTMPLHGNAPPTQVTQVTSSTGAFLQSYVSTSTGTGGNWLKVSPGGYNNAPFALAVSLDQAVASLLPAGNYTAEVILTPNSGAAPAIAVPVTLTIAPPSQPFFGNLPGGLNFSLPANSKTPVNQVFQIEDNGSGPLNWAVASHTADGGDWLTVSPVSGTTPSLLTVGIVSDRLPNGGALAGIYTGQLLFTGGSGSVTVPVTVSIGGNSLVQINPLSFTMPLHGSAPLTQLAQVTSSTGAFLQSYVSASTGTGGNWLKVSPGGYNNAPFALAVGVDQTVASLLPAGSYTGEVILTPNSGSAAAMTIPVTLTIAPPTLPFFDNVPGALNFSVKANATNPPNQLMEIRNAGSGILNWTSIASTSDGGNWLTVSPGTEATPTKVTVGIVTQNLPNAGHVAGIFTGNLLFEVVGGSTTVTVPVTVSVGGNSLVQINPLSFTMPLHGNVPLPQVTQIISSAGAFLQSYVSASSGTGGDWLKVSPGGYNNAPFPLIVSVDETIASLLPAGSYTAEAILTPNSGSAAAIAVPVTLTIAPPSQPFFDNLPGGLYFSAQTSSGDPANQVIQIRNEGISQLNWTVTPITADGGNWLTVTESSGTAPSTVTVAVAAQNLPDHGALTGIYTGQLIFQSAYGSYTVPVTVDLGSDVFLQANGLTFTLPPDAASKTLTIASLGKVTQFYSSSFTGNGGDWLTVRPGGYSNTPIAETFTVNTTGLARGSYTGQAIFNSGRVAQTVQVNLNTGGTPPATIVATSGTPQTAQINTDFLNPFVATVKDGSGSPIRGQLVTFTAPASGPSGTFSGQTTATAITDASGQAVSPVFTANAVRGSYAVSATVSGLSASFSLTNSVLAPVLSSIAISGPAASLTQGATEQFTATGTYTDGSIANLTAQVSWSSSNPAAAIISASGLATAVTAGSTAISATLSNVASNAFALSVTPPVTPPASPLTVLSYSVLFGSESYTVTGSTRNRLPWQITGIRVQFSQPVTSGNISSLGGLQATSFSGLGTAALTWSFNAISLGEVATALSGSGANALTDALGNPLANGAGVSQAFRVLWGDFDDDGNVTSADMVGVNNASIAAYNVFADQNGDGVVDVADVQTVRSRLATSLP